MNVLSGKKRRFLALDETRYKCTSQDCEFIGKTFKNLKNHEYTAHADERPYACTESDCLYRSKQQTDLQKHMITHTGEHPFVCAEPQCSSKYTTLSKLRAHERAKHSDPSNWYRCDVPNCGYVSRYNMSLTRHLYTHINAKPLRCQYCTFATMWHGALTVHERLHTGERPFDCSDTNCDASFTTSSRAARHFQTWHTPGAARRRKRKEQRVADVLTTANIPFEREVHITFACFTAGGNKKFARVDFVIYTDRAIFLLEVDEHQHHKDRSPWDYSVLCDMARMSRVQTALTIGHADPQTIVWLRYNPDTFFVDNVRQRVLLRDREKHLVTLIRNYTPQNNALVSILYLYYDCRSIDKDNATSSSQAGTVLRPLILDDKEYDEQIAACVQLQ